MEFLPGAFEQEWERRRAALLHELEMGQGGSSDWEIERRGGPVARGVEEGRSGAFSPHATHHRRALRVLPARARSSIRPMRLRFQEIAKGSQPAVVKLASYGSGARACSMLNYVSRAGELRLETETGEHVIGKEALADVRGDWKHLFDNRTDSRDLAVFRVAIEIGEGGVGQRDLEEKVRNVLERGFGDRHFVYAVEQAEFGAAKIEGIVVLRDSQGERLTGDAKAAAIVQERYDLSPVASPAGATFSFCGYGNGVEYGTARVRDLVDRFEGEVRDERGCGIETSEQAGDLVQREWRKDLHSRKGRDVMHLVMSARAGTEAAAFNDAVRDFLGHQFAGHRYVFALHDPADDPKDSERGGKRPHVHAHAIITMRSEDGDRIETSPRVFREWRAAMAEKAREHSIDMEMTDRREFASAPAYTRNQVRPVSHVGRTEHEGTSEAARARYAAKRGDLHVVSGSRRSREYAVAAKQEWRELAQANSHDAVAAYAASQIERIQFAWKKIEKEAELSVLTTDSRSNMVILEKLIEGEEGRMREMTRPEFEVYENRVETVLLNVEKSLEVSERNDFGEVAAAAREVVSIRREYLEISEQQASTENRNDENTLNDDQQWDQAVAKHGQSFVDQGNDVMVEVEAARASIDRAEESGRDATSAESDLRRELERAAWLAVDGNSYLHEVAETDQDLRLAIEAAERVHTQDRIDADRDSLAGDRRSADTARDMEGRQAAMSSHEAPVLPRAANSTPGSVESESERLRDVSRDAASVGDVERDIEDQQEAGLLNDERRSSREQRDSERTAKSANQKALRSDPPQQHIPRLRELEREIEQKNERDRDDYER